MGKGRMVDIEEIKKMLKEKGLSMDDFREVLIQNKVPSYVEDDNGNYTRVHVTDIDEEGNIIGYIYDS